mgnify:CR=1 FL=1
MSLEVPRNPEEQRRLLRSLMNIRLPRPLPEDIQQMQDEYLKEQGLGIVRAVHLSECLHLPGTLHSHLHTGKGLDLVVNARMGVFRFPAKRAAEIAVSTVTDWLRQHPGAMDCVIFNVFKDEDREIYETLLS